jgi:DNA-3-methyladenine glycosylase I
MTKDIVRCGWVTDDPLYMNYHDHEWGVPVYDERLLFEFLNLEGAQAGLSWMTILKKRDCYRVLFDQFDAEKIAQYDEHKVASLLANPGIVRNKLKIAAVITNARAMLDLREAGVGFSEYIWQFVDGKPIKNRWDSLKQVPVKTAQSDAMSSDLKRRGFKFVGSTICYAYMQAVGMVDDHIADCFRCQR